MSFLRLRYSVLKQKFWYVDASYANSIFELGCVVHFVNEEAGDGFHEIYAEGSPAYRFGGPYTDFFQFRRYSQVFGDTAPGRVRSPLPG
jgi:hypothetical protein